MNEKWFLNDVSNVEKKLKTNAASGLTPKAARSRYRKEDSRFFIKTKKKMSSLLGEILADFSLILLIISSVIALCFTEYTTGVTLIVIMLLNLAICLYLSFRTQRTFESLSDFFCPSVTVIRSGKVFSIDAEHVVKGDVVLIGEGDILPFDARLVTSDALRVSVRIDRQREEICEKHAEGLVREGENNIANMVNMVHAGSRVVSGSARAIVTATGRYTYFGAMTGGVRYPLRADIPHGLKLLRKYCQSFGLVITVAILPFSMLSLIFSHGNVTLMATFTASLAIAASSLSQLACTACRVFFAKQAKLCLKGKDPSVFRGAEIMDRLVSSEYLFLLDGSAVTDGVLHFHKAICAEGEILALNSISYSALALSELAALYNSAENKALTVGVHAPGRYRIALEEFVNKTGVDVEALKIRCNISGYVPGNSLDKTDKLFYTDKGAKRILCVSQSSEAVLRCGRCYISNGISPISDKGRRDLASEYEKYSKSGMRVLVFTLSENEFSQNDIFVGILVFSEMLDPAFASAVSGMKAFGVKTVSFSDSFRSGYGERLEIPAPNFGVSASILDFEATNKPITYKFGDIDTYKDLPIEYIDKLIAHVHSMNKKVSVLCFSDKYRELHEKPDVIVSCSPLQYRLSGRFEEAIEAIEVAGSAESLSARQDVKADADMLIPRPGKQSGGLASLRRALVYSGAAYSNLAGFFRYVLCAQFVRIVMVMLPMIFGESFLDARHVLFCGFIIDLMAMLVFVTDKCGIENARGFRSISGEFKAPLRNNAGIITAGALGAMCAIILPNIIGYLGIMGQYLYQTECRFLAMVFLHITLVYCIRIDNLRRFGAADINKAAIALDIVVPLFLVACFAIEGLGAFFEIRTISVGYFFLALIPSALCIALYFLLSVFRLHTED